MYVRMDWNSQSSFWKLYTNTYDEKFLLGGDKKKLCWVMYMCVFSLDFLIKRVSNQMC